MLIDNPNTERMMAACADLNKICVITHDRYREISKDATMRGILTLFKIMVVDEAHEACNLESSIGQCVANFPNKIILLTGTPVRNNPLQTWVTFSPSSIKSGPSEPQNM